VTPVPLNDPSASTEKSYPAVLTPPRKLSELEELVDTAEDAAAEVEEVEVEDTEVEEVEVFDAEVVEVEVEEVEADDAEVEDATEVDKDATEVEVTEVEEGEAELKGVPVPVDEAVVEPEVNTEVASLSGRH